MFDLPCKAKSVIFEGILRVCGGCICGVVGSLMGWTGACLSDVLDIVMCLVW